MVVCRTVATVTIFAIIGFVVLGAGLFLLFWFPTKIEKTIANRLPINNGSDSFKLWKKPPSPYRFEVHLFHVENADSVVLGEKPKLIQKGPYVFKEYKEKYDVVFDDEEDEVSFLTKKTFVYDESLSNGSLGDNVTILNVPLLGVSKQAMTLTGYKKLMLNMAIQLYKAKPFVTRNVSQLLFEGYKDRLIESLAAKMNKTLLPNNTFGFLYGQNGSSDGISIVKRGNRDISQIAHIEVYKNMSSLPYWRSNYCNMINGTDGTQFAPSVKRNQLIYLYAAELCRSVYLEYQQDVVVKNIRLYRFVATSRLVAMGDGYPENDCYCPASGCQPSGVLNVSTCRKGAPLLISLPHFYLADKKYLNDVDGLSPDQQLHQIHLDVEPNTGLVMSASKRLQVNADVRPVKGLTGYSKMPIVTFPLLWVAEGATISPQSAERFRSQLQHSIMLANAITYALIGVGLFILLCLVSCIVISSVVTRSRRVSKPVSIKATSENNGPASEKLLTRPGFA